MNTMVVYFVISILCYAMIFADYFAWRQFRRLLAKAKNKLSEEQTAYMARQMKIGKSLSGFGLVALAGSLIAALFDPTQWSSTIGLALGAICFAMSWHNTTVMSSRLKTMVAGGKRGDQ